MLPEEIEGLQTRLATLEAENAELRKELLARSENAAPAAESSVLRDSETNWRSLIESVPDYLIILDPNGVIYWINRVNPPLRRPEELIGVNLLDFATPETRPVVEQAIRTALETGRTVDFTTPAQVNDEKRWYLSRVTPLAAAAPRRLLIIALDITQQVRMEEENRRIERKLQETQQLESLGILAGGVAHDFNNLLTVILGNASLIRMQTMEGLSIQTCLEQIDQAALRAADLCRQMLAYSGRGRFVVAPLDLGVLVREATPLLRSAVSKKATLQLDLGANLPAVVADAVQLRQILMNLVLNGSEALDDRAGTVVVETGVMHADAAYLAVARSFAKLRMGEYVFLEVRDNGHGMTPEVQARIFDPFYTTKFTGRGLGLAAVLGIVRGHGGALHVRSEVGVGTTIRLLLPPSAAPVPEPVTEASKPQWCGEGVVLVVDDEDAVRQLAVHLLRTAGFDVLEARDGQAAVELYAREAGRIRLVLLDLMMPRLDGEQALREIRRVRPDVRAIVMSGFSEHEILHRFAEAPPDGFLQKPFARDQLFSLVARVLGDQEQADKMG